MECKHLFLEREEQLSPITKCLIKDVKKPNLLVITSKAISIGILNVLPNYECPFFQSKKENECPFYES